jgi:hypothetical protein
MSTLTELGDFLEAMGVAVQAPDAAANLFLGSRPDVPDTVLVLYEYPGSDPEYVQNSFFPIAEMPQIQVVARANRYEDASDLAWAAWSALAPVTNATLGTTYYRSIRPNGSPAILMRDTNDRVLLFFNASVEKEVSVGVIS